MFNPKEYDPHARQTLQETAMALMYLPDSVTWMVYEPMRPSYRNHLLQQHFVSVVLLLFGVILMYACIKNQENTTAYLFILIIFLAFLCRIIWVYVRYGLQIYVPNYMRTEYTINFTLNRVYVWQRWQRLSLERRNRLTYSYSYLDYDTVPLPPLPVDTDPLDIERLNYIREEIERRSRFKAVLYHEHTVPIPKN